MSRPLQALLLVILFVASTLLGGVSVQGADGPRVHVQGTPMPQPMAVGAIADLRITLVGSDVVLTWSADSNATGYDVFRATSVDTFDFGTPLAGGVPGISYTDSGAGIGTAADYYYIVRGVGSTLNSSLVFKQHREYVTSGPATFPPYGWRMNLLPIWSCGSPFQTTSDIVADINAQNGLPTSGPGSDALVNNVASWGLLSQVFDTNYTFIPGNQTWIGDFPVQPGYAIALNLTDGAAYSHDTVGTVCGFNLSIPALPPTGLIMFANPPGTGWNMTEDLVVDVNVFNGLSPERPPWGDIIRTLSTWDIVTQSLGVSYSNLFGTFWSGNFALAGHDALIIDLFEAYGAMNLGTTTPITPPIGETGPPPPPVMTIEKVANTTSVEVGGQVQYTITLTNTGNSTANVNTTDVLPANLAWTSFWASAATSTGVSGQSIWWNLTDLGAGSSVVMIINTTATAVGLATQNCANMNYSDAAWVFGGTGSSCTSVDIIPPQPDMTVTKVGPVTVTSGQTMNYSIVIVNSGTGTAGYVWLNDTLPVGMTWLSDGASAIPGFISMGLSGPELVYNFTNIAPGGYAFNISVLVEPTVTDGTLLINCVDLDFTDTLGSRLPSATDCEGTMVVAPPSTSIGLRAGATTIGMGDVVLCNGTAVPIGSFVELRTLDHQVIDSFPIGNGTGLPGEFNTSVTVPLALLPFDAYLRAYDNSSRNLEVAFGDSAPFTITGNGTTDLTGWPLCESAEVLMWEGFEDFRLWGIDNFSSVGWGITGNRVFAGNQSMYYGDKVVFNYDTGEREYGSIIIPYPFDLTDSSGAELRFNTWWEIEGFDPVIFDQLMIEVSDDQGLGWTVIETLNPTTSSGGSQYSSCGPDAPGCWVEESIDLTAFVDSEVLIRFSFDTTDQFWNVYEGWYIDNVRVLRAEPIPAAGTFKVLLTPADRDYRLGGVGITELAVKVIDGNDRIDPDGFLTVNIFPPDASGPIPVNLTQAAPGLYVGAYDHSALAGQYRVEAVANDSVFGQANAEPVFFDVWASGYRSDFSAACPTPVQTSALSTPFSVVHTSGSMSLRLIEYGTGLTMIWPLVEVTPDNWVRTVPAGMPEGVYQVDFLADGEFVKDVSCILVIDDAILGFIVDSNGDVDSMAGAIDIVSVTTDTNLTIYPGIPLVNASVAIIEWVDANGGKSLEVLVSNSVHAAMIYADINVSYDEAEIPPWLAEEDIGIFVFDRFTGTWEETTTGMDMAGDDVWGGTDHFSLFGIHPQPYHHNTSLFTGWNLIGFPNLNGVAGRSLAFSSIAGQYDILWSYDRSTGSPAWHSWVAARPAFMNDLDLAGSTNAYWVNVTSAGQELYSAGALVDRPVTLYPGWNLVGYPSIDASPTIGEALTGVTWTGLASEEGGLLVDLTGEERIGIGRGYWIQVPSSQIWSPDADGV